MTTLNRPRTCGEDMPTDFPKLTNTSGTDFEETAATRKPRITACVSKGMRRPVKQLELSR